jgi:hypothetical protein
VLSILIFGFIIITSIAVAVSVYLRLFAPLRRKEKGYDFVFVEKDGTARELDYQEIEYLERPFMTDDLARPVIKKRYDEKSETGSIEGFILRRRVPPHIPIVKGKLKNPGAN